MYYLGIDTSNYTTSVAVVDKSGKLVYENRRLLVVPQGEHGLRQSEALFQHVKAFPQLYQVPADIAVNLTGVGVSARPRDVEGSYMPVFLAGQGFAQTIAQTLGIPLLECSHQHNHLAAGFWSAGWWPQDERVLGVHLSGGTSEVLELTWSDDPNVTLIGETRDLNAGQFIDRVGVALGLSFPAGPHLEELAKGATGQVRLASPVEGMNMSFSGPLSAALRLVGDVEASELARGVEDCIAKAVEKVLIRAKEDGHRQVLLVGGVMCNSRIRQRLIQRLEHKAVAMKLHFATPQASRDSAIGCAVLAWRKFCK